MGGLRPGMPLSTQWRNRRLVHGDQVLNLAEYAGLLIYLILGTGFIGGIFLVSSLLRERRNDPLSRSVYECGMETIGSPYVSPNIRFYVFALLFVIFDIEAAFILPWAVKFKELGMVALIEMIVFIVILFTGLIFAWKKGALKWE
jgi:NADH-quinone oxidoreductase subunit A